MRHPGQRHRRAAWIVVGAICATAALIGSLVERADAIPAFARKHNMACSNCHAVSFPKLNDFGNRFRDQGYQLGTDEDLPAETHFAYWPVSIRTTVGYQYATASKLAVGNPATSQAYASGSSLGFTGLDILSFGTLARDVSYGVVYVPGLAGAAVNTGSTAAGGADLEFAFVRFHNLIHGEQSPEPQDRQARDRSPFQRKAQPHAQHDLRRLSLSTGDSVRPSIQQSGR